MSTHGNNADSPKAAQSVQMRRAPSRGAATTFSMEVFDNEVVPSSLATISPILRVASEIESERPRVAYLCRFYAFEKAHRLDQSSTGRGVRQFKTLLLQRLERSHNDFEQSEKTTSNNSKSSSRFSKKNKRKSTAGLTKCTMKKGEIDPEDLIGCRIKTWWPADKKFYGGTIKSSDSLKKKHVILYDDGDVEILRLDKERWELLDKGRKSTKIKRPSLETSFGRKHNGSPSKKKKVSDKQSPSKPVKPRKKYASKSDFHQEETKETFELSNHEETMTSEADEMNSGGSEKELTSGSDEITANGKKSNKKVRSVSRRKKLKKTKNFRNMEVSEESDEDEQNYSERSSEDRESVPQYSSDERSADESTEALRENVDNEEEAESEEDQDNNDVGDSPGETEKSHIEPSSPDDVSIADISDDAPLNWRNLKNSNSFQQDQAQDNHLY